MISSASLEYKLMIEALTSLSWNFPENVFQRKSQDVKLRLKVCKIPTEIQNKKRQLACCFIA